MADVHDDSRSKSSIRVVIFDPLTMVLIVHRHVSELGRASWQVVSRDIGAGTSRT